VQTLLKLKTEQSNISNSNTHAHPLQSLSVYDKLIANNYFKLLVTLIAFSIPALSLTLNSGYSIGSGLLSIIALGYLPKLWGYFQAFEKDDKILIVTLLSYFLIFSISVVLDGFHTRELDRPSRFLFASLALIILLKTKIKGEYVLYGVIVGAAGTGLLALYQYFMLDMARPTGFQIVIAYGNDSFLLALLALAAVGFFSTHKKYTLLALCVIAAILGMTAFMLSGTRGGWLATPLALLVLWSYRKTLKVRLQLLIVTLIFALTLILLLNPNIQTLERLKIANSNFDRYFSGGIINTSTGLRLEMWKSALYSFKENPIFGSGEYGNKAYRKKQIDQGLVSSAVYKFNHAHNELLTALSHRGLVGFLSILSIYLVPLWLFSKVLFSKQLKANPDKKVMALGGCLISLSYFSYGLTQSMLYHNSGSTIYPFFIIIYWAALKSFEETET
jgi:O-antigen ligase